MASKTQAQKNAVMARKAGVPAPRKTKSWYEGYADGQEFVNFPARWRGPKGPTNTTHTSAPGQYRDGFQVGAHAATEEKRITAYRPTYNKTLASVATTVTNRPVGTKYKDA